jgi:tetratricopeptide (TPR) repeat protein
MILTQCAVCATELGLTLGKKCGRCSTRYCGPECQVQHWKEGGHDKLCKSIKKAGGAEQYNANKKYAAAVTVAAEACAEDTNGQTCYICTQALHWKTKEGLVRMCACRGTAGFAHVSCLAEQAKILMAEAEENNLGPDALNARMERWYRCSQCKQQYHGVVKCALGWACWKTYLGRPETDQPRQVSINLLGNGLFAANRYEDALSVEEANLSLMRRLGAPEQDVLTVQSNLAATYQQMGLKEQAVNMERDVYFGYLKLNGEEDEDTLRAATNYANSLTALQRYQEAKSLMRRTLPVARRVTRDSSDLSIRMRTLYAQTFYLDDAATLDGLREAVTTLEETERTARRVLGGAHPTTKDIERVLRKARAALRAREDAAPGGDVSAMREAMAAMTAGDA